jgi:spermidine synthase
MGAPPLPLGSATARRERLLAAAVFFLSGTSALVYQVSWQRILALHTGVGIQSVAIIVAAFMAGLGLGSHFGGMLSARRSPRAALRVFALLELSIAVFGALSCVFYYDWLYLQAHWTFGSTWRMAVHHFVALALPTTLMGMSLPFLVHGMVRTAATAYRTIGVLYAVNVFGASAGALATPWLLIPNVGIRGAVLAAAAVNLVAATGALVLAAWVRDIGSPSSEASAADPPVPVLEVDPDAPAGRPFALWVALYALSGACALALEILWFRVIDVGVKATAYTFGTVLAVYLAGLACGTLAGVRAMARVRRPLQVFLICQCVLLAYSAAAMLLIATISTDTPIYNDYARYWARNRTFVLGADSGLGDTLRLYLFWPAFLFGLPTFLMGLSFTTLQRAVHDDVRTSGRKVGTLQAANIAGNVAGSLLVGLVALSALGTTGTMRVLTAAGLVFAATGTLCYRRRWPFAALAAVLAILVATGPTQRQLWTRLHGLYEGPTLVEEDATSVVSIRPWVQDKSELWINGRRHSLLPYGGIHTSLGALPALIHEAPRTVAVVGLGSGDTPWAAGCRTETAKVTVYEICSPIERLLRAYQIKHKQDQNLRAFLSDPRMDMQLADGRNALARSSALYDIIEMDALHPESAYSGNLYSEEFYRLAASRLAPGGIMSAWAATPRVNATFRRVFPHVLTFEDDNILLGSFRPFRVDVEAWKQRVLSEPVRAYLGPRNAGRTLEVLDGWRANPAAAAVSAPNLDLFPRDEFGVND